MKGARLTKKTKMFLPEGVFVQETFLPQGALVPEGAFVQETFLSQWALVTEAIQE